MADTKLTGIALSNVENGSQLDTKAKKTLIVQMYAEGFTIRRICDAVSIDPATLNTWRIKDTVFDTECLSAQNIGFELHADSLHTIYDEEEDVNRARGKSDNIKWLLSKRHATKYGDRIALDINNTIDLKGALIDAQQRLAKLPESRQVIEVQAIEITKQLEKSTTAPESVDETNPDAISLEDILK